MSVLSSIVSKVFQHQRVEPGKPVDVAATLDRMAEERPVLEPLNWSGSMVDMLKLLNLDSGPNARRALALELRYSGDPHDMLHTDNWLHTEVMKRLMEKAAQMSGSQKH